MATSIQQARMRILFACLGLGIAAILNYGLPEKNIDLYLWLLKPISFLLHLILNQDYVACAQGYFFTELGALITPRCAGLRFMGMLWIGVGLFPPLAYCSLFYASKPADLVGPQKTFLLGKSMAHDPASEPRLFKKAVLTLIVFWLLSSTIYLFTVLAASSRILVLLMLDALANALPFSHNLLGSFVYLFYFMLAGIAWQSLLARLRLERAF